MPSHVRLLVLLYVLLPPMTTRASTKAKAWAVSVGPYGHRLRVFEDPNSGILYGEMKDASTRCGYRTVSLRHRDRDRAVKWAHDQVAKWMNGDDELRRRLPTVAHVMALYLQHQTPTKVQSEQDADQRRAKMWTRVLGAGGDLEKLSLRDWQAFSDARTSGSINAHGEQAAAGDQRPVRAATTAADLVFLISVLNWATKWREGDRYLMRENPARGFPVPTERNPRRPVATDDRFDKVRAVAAQVTMLVGPKTSPQIAPSCLPELLDLAHGTGRRISAICSLRYEDLRLSDGPHGSIRWPAETDKIKREWVVPMSADVRAAIDRVLRQRPGIGAAYLFPSGRDASKPVRTEVASAWLRRAEKLAKVEKQSGSLWHAYRRGWATARKHLPVPDVAAAGGWADQHTLMSVYQQADQATMYTVVSEPTKLRESGAHR